MTSIDQRGAPIPAVRANTIDRLKSTHSGHSPVLLDDLVGAGEDRGREREAEFFRSLQIDRKLKMRGLIHWQFPGRCATKDANHVVRGAAEQLGEIGAVP